MGTERAMFMVRISKERSCLALLVMALARLRSVFYEADITKIGQEGARFRS